MNPFFPELDKWADKIKKQNKDLLPAIVEEIGGNVVAETPVLSGRLKGAWHASLTGPRTKASGNVDKDGSATLAAMVEVARNAPLGKTLYIINNAVSGPEDDGGAGIHYAGIVNGTPSIRFNMDFAPLAFPSFMFFDRAVGGAMLSYAVTAATQRIIV